MCINIIKLMLHSMVFYDKKYIIIIQISIFLFVKHIGSYQPTFYASFVNNLDYTLLIIWIRYDVGTYQIFYIHIFLFNIDSLIQASHQ